MTSDSTLLQKAKLCPQRKQRAATEQEIELALAWVNDEITYSQAQEALTGNRGGMTAYVRLAIALRDYLRKTK